VQANRTPLSSYFHLIEKLPAEVELAEREQIINAFDYINRLLIGNAAREKFQNYARSILRPTFDRLDWEPKKDDAPGAALLRASLIEALGELNDQEIVAGCRQRFQKYIVEPRAIVPDLRASVFRVVGHYADDPTWSKLRELGLKTTSTEEKQNYYDALASARDPQLVTKSLQISLTDELPTSRAVFLVGKVARDSDHPDLAWDFARANMKALLSKTDAVGINRYAPSLFTFFSEESRADELKAYAKTNLPPASAKEVAKAVDEIQFRSEFKKRLANQLSAWIENQRKRK
jgi:hypothetical protein